MAVAKRDTKVVVLNNITLQSKTKRSCTTRLSKTKNGKGGGCNSTQHKSGLHQEILHVVDLVGQVLVAQDFGTAVR